MSKTFTDNLLSNFYWTLSHEKVALIDGNDFSRKGVYCMSSEGSSTSSYIFKN